MLKLTLARLQRHNQSIILILPVIPNSVLVAYPLTRVSSNLLPSYGVPEVIPDQWRLPKPRIRLLIVSSVTAW